MDINEDRHCFSCGKTFSKPFYYERHKNRKTPCLIQDIPENDNAVLRCKFCNKTYKHNYTLNRHYKTCKIKNGGMDILVKKVQREEELEQKVMLNTLLKKVEFMEQKIHDLTTTANSNNTNNTNNTINTNNTQINTNNITQNITINSYKDPNTEGITLSPVDIDNHERIAYALIDKIYFNPEKPENHSIYLVNKKDKTLMVYKNPIGKSITGINSSGLKWHTLTTEKDRNTLTKEIQNIIIQKGSNIVNMLYGDDEDKFLKLPRGLAKRIINYNGYELEARVDEQHMLQYALKHKDMVEDTRKYIKS
jgi:hypothetical protein